MKLRALEGILHSGIVRKVDDEFEAADELAQSLVERGVAEEVKAKRGRSSSNDDE